MPPTEQPDRFSNKSPFDSENPREESSSPLKFTPKEQFIRCTINPDIGGSTPLWSMPGLEITLQTRKKEAYDKAYLRSGLLRHISFSGEIIDSPDTAITAIVDDQAISVSKNTRVLILDSLGYNSFLLGKDLLLRIANNDKHFYIRLSALPNFGYEARIQEPELAQVEANFPDQEVMRQMSTADITLFLYELAIKLSKKKNLLFSGNFHKINEQLKLLSQVYTLRAEADPLSEKNRRRFEDSEKKETKNVPSENPPERPQVHDNFFMFACTQFVDSILGNEADELKQITKELDKHNTSFNPEQRNELEEKRFRIKQKQQAYTYFFASLFSQDIKRHINPPLYNLMKDKTIDVKINDYLNTSLLWLLSSKTTEEFSQRLFEISRNTFKSQRLEIKNPATCMAFYQEKYPTELNALLQLLKGYKERHIFIQEEIAHLTEEKKNKVDKPTYPSMLSRLKKNLKDRFGGKNSKK